MSELIKAFGLEEWSIGMQIFALLVIFLALNIFTFAVFALDKWKSQNNQWRIPEKTLLGLALLGGSPALVLGQKLLRHKTVKQPFGLFLKLIIALQIIGILIVFMDIGQFDLEWLERFILGLSRQ